ncbi:hypothetical protein HFC70_08140 [Agrobacterium sp. a22-2]|uniref:hypothetical protein n=1 Tax=Agrobacterium sp. a22-2 TaxID=2283840 RepID=UPI00144565EE|nr:hypothetical protein [Agrobacterium sp. a22-2]NKN36327.1 hypothetical protein [Agrobacterium sp. a22-2]
MDFVSKSQSSGIVADLSKHTVVTAVEDAAMPSAAACAPTRSYQNGAAYFQVNLLTCFVDFCPGKQAYDTLVVSFEGAGPPFERPDGTRDGFGTKFLTDSGYSVLAFKPKIVNWYRSPDVVEYFKFLAASRFFHGFSNVVFTGGSMGGYASLAFSAVHPGSTIVAIQPQSTLAPHIVPWEDRWNYGRQYDWHGPFADAIDSTRLAKRVIVAYDPMLKQDAMHVHRLDQHNIFHVQLPFVGHKVGGAMRDAGVLKDFTRWSINGELDHEKCRHIRKSCRASTAYYEGAIPALMRRQRKKAVAALLKHAPLNYEEFPRAWMAASQYYSAVGEIAFADRQWKAVAKGNSRNARLGIGCVRYLAETGRTERASARLAWLLERAVDKAFVRSWAETNAPKLNLVYSPVDIAATDAATNPGEAAVQPNEMVER